MSVHIDQFAIYAAKIFEVLYDSFPISARLDRNSIISEYLTFDQSEELKNLKMKNDFADIVEMTDDEELKSRVRQQIPAVKEKINVLENEQRYDRHRQEAIYEGTLEFLISEQLLRELESGGYQLTSKGFSHLNMVFESGKISDDRRSNIAILKTIFEKSSDTSLQVAASTAVNVITRMIGYG
ncbi:hypothetical protein [Halomonas rhizosphaerae]|nr:hypothetical protein [Halomonas rhizosphaerae]